MEVRATFEYLSQSKQKYLKPDQMMMLGSTFQMTSADRSGREPYGRSIASEIHFSLRAYLQANAMKEPSWTPRMLAADAKMDWFVWPLQPEGCA